MDTLFFSFSLCMKGSCAASTAEIRTCHVWSPYFQPCKSFWRENCGEPFLEAFLYQKSYDVDTSGWSVSPNDFNTTVTTVCRQSCLGLSWWQNISEPLIWTLDCRTTSNPASWEHYDVVAWPLKALYERRRILNSLEIYLATWSKYKVTRFLACSQEKHVPVLSL